MHKNEFYPVCLTSLAKEGVSSGLNAPRQWSRSSNNKAAIKMYIFQYFIYYQNSIMYLAMNYLLFK